MGTFFVLAVAIAAFAVLDLAALRWGVDSRPGSVDPNRPADPIGLR